MYSVNHKNANNTPTFGKFLKVKGSTKHINHLKKRFAQNNDDILLLSQKKENKKSVLYIFTKEDTDIFLDLIKKIDFFELRTNIEKYMPTKLKILDLAKAYEIVKKKSCNKYILLQD